MLANADHKPEIVERSMNGVYELYGKGVFTHIQGQTYSEDELIKAHQMLEDGKTIGKLAIQINKAD